MREIIEQDRQDKTRKDKTRKDKTRKLKKGESEGKISMTSREVETD